MFLPKHCEILEDELYSDDLMVINLGDGPMSRYRTLGEVINEWRKHINIGSVKMTEKDWASYAINVERMLDSSISVVHIEGKNQLADTMTKMACSIDLVGRIEFDYKNFVLKQKTPIRDEDGTPVPYTTKGNRKRYDTKLEELLDKQDFFECLEDIENMLDIELNK